MINKSNESSINEDLYRIYFNDLLHGETYVKKNSLLKFIKLRGISLTDNRIRKQLELLEEDITFNKFIELINTNILLFEKIFENDLIIANWNKFINDIDNIYENTMKIHQEKLPHIFLN